MQKHNFKKPIVPVYSPMRFKLEDWEAEANILIETTQKYKRVAFVTLGDAGIYSSVYYLLERIKDRDFSLYQNSEVVAGVTSFSDASAKVKKPLCLGDSALEIIPLLDKEVAKTKIFMRPKIGMDTKDIEEEGEVYTFENLNFKDEKIYSKKLQKVERYMTLFIDFFKG